MRVQEGPDELAADVFDAEFEVCVLVNRVMPAVKGGGANVDALLVGDFIRVDEARRIAGARSSDGRIERMGKGVAQCDAGRPRFHGSGRRSAIKHAGLRRHVEK